MRTFYIKQKMWSLGGEFTVTDETGQAAFLVEGSFFQIPKSFTITSISGQPVSRIESRLWSFLPKFDVLLADGSYFSIQKEWSFLRSSYRIDDLGMTIQGDWWDMNFDLVKDGNTIARISQEWLAFTSTYSVMVLEEEYSNLVLSLVIAIDYVKEQDNH